MNNLQIFSLAVVLIGGQSLAFPQIQSGFEFLGAVEDKVFVRPIESKRFTYQEAIITCVSAGYQIATVESAAQEAILKPHVCKESNFRWSWIDGTDFQDSLNFFSINTGKNLTYFNWVAGSPRKFNNLPECIRYSCNTIDGPTMWDVSCTDKLEVFCQVAV